MASRVTYSLAVVALALTACGTNGMSSQEVASDTQAPRAVPSSSASPRNAAGSESAGAENSTRCDIVEAHADFRSREWFPSADEALEWASQRSPHGFAPVDTAETASDQDSGTFVYYENGQLAEVADVTRDADGQWSVDSIDTCGGGS